MKVSPFGKERYRLYSEYFKEIFGGRVQKVSVDAGFTCPNRDGNKGYGGCTYCDNQAFNPSYCNPEKPIRKQIDDGVEFHQKRYRRADLYLVYFQPFSNTYASVEKLRNLFQEALLHPRVKGLVIGTRADCMNTEILEMLRELSLRHYIIIEYGLESCYDKTLQRINRGHTFAEFAGMIQLTAAYGLHSGAHLIFGLPGETREEMLAESGIISDLPLTTVKFHQLQIIRGTKMEQEHLNDPGDFTFFDLDEYIDFVIDFAERLNPGFVIERFAGEVPPRFLSTQGWGLIRYDAIVSRIKKRMAERDTWQGKLYRPL